MSYELNTKELMSYIYGRVHDPNFRGMKLIDIEFSEDNKNLILATHKGDKVVFYPSFIPGREIKGKKEYDRIEIEIEPHKAGVNSTDVVSFLEKLVQNNEIFNRGQPLFSYERQENIPKWKEVLERDDNLEEHKMVCLIIDEDVSTERLRKTIYEYMFRPCLYYLFNQGKFS